MTSSAGVAEIKGNRFVYFFLSLIVTALIFSELSVEEGKSLSQTGTKGPTNGLIIAHGRLYVFVSYALAVLKSNTSTLHRTIGSLARSRCVSTAL